MAKIAVVSGGTRGIGAAIARGLHAAAYTVVATYHQDDATAARFHEETGIAVYRWDVADVAASDTGMKRVEAEVGPVDVLINNAGITRDSIFHRMTYDQWSAVLRTNLDSMFAMTRPIIEGMRNRGNGRIINISSINGQKGQIGQANYSAAKAGILGFTKALALENARRGITVNAICPGYIDTDMVAGIPEQVLVGIIAGIPMGRLGKADEIGSLAVYLASDAAAFITGAVFAANGGQYLG